MANFDKIGSHFGVLGSAYVGFRPWVPDNFLMVVMSVESKSRERRVKNQSFSECP